MPNNPSRPQRRLRNFLLDSRFQLKLVGYSVLMALTVAALLGGFLWTTARALTREAEVAVEARAQAAQASRELSNTTLSVELVKNIDDPEFERRLKERSQEIDARYDAERAQVTTQRDELAKRQRALWLSLSASLLLFVVFIAGVTILATHRIAGPVMRIKRLVVAVAEGRLEAAGPSLREGDELQELFQATARMVQTLRETRQQELLAVEALLERARKGEPVVEELEALKARVQGPLG